MLTDYMPASEIPTFYFYWMSLYSADMKRSVLVKCVTSLPADIPHVQVAFQCFQGTRTDQFALLHLIDICILTQDDHWDDKFDLVSTSQRNFEEQFTRVVLTGFRGRNPFFTQVAWDGYATHCTVVHHIFMGGIQDQDGTDIDNLIVKLTADSAFERYYLYSCNEDAQALIRYGRILKTVLSVDLISRWVRFVSKHSKLRTLFAAIRPPLFQQPTLHQSYQLTQICR